MGSEFRKVDEAFSFMLRWKFWGGRYDDAQQFSSRHGLAWPALRGIVAGMAFDGMLMWT